jgi:hypothetical protein
MNGKVVHWEAELGLCQRQQRWECKGSILSDGISYTKQVFMNPRVRTRHVKDSKVSELQRSPQLAWMDTEAKYAQPDTQSTGEMRG